ncbi:hypothetical protein [Tepidimonas sp.]|uniref:hypothetical protein n=1 Tax=Tepidimonas sp. TaxID=2002775 RepID=UPI0039190BB5
MVRSLVPYCRVRVAAGVLTAVGWAMAPALQAQPHLRCELEASHEVIRLDVRLVTDPYPVAAVPVGRSFRFKAVLLADGDGSAAAPLGVQRVYSHRTGSELRYTCAWEVQP